VTVQVLAAKGLAQDVVWDEAKVRAEAEWVDRLLEDQAEVVSVQNAEQRLLMLPESLAIKEAVLNVV
jgi:hypothetical protein